MRDGDLARSRSLSYLGLDSSSHAIHTLLHGNNLLKIRIKEASCTTAIVDTILWRGQLEGATLAVSNQRSCIHRNAIGLPFPTGTNAEDTPACIVYGLVGNGAGCHGARPSPPDGAYAASGAPKPIVETGDSSNEVLAAAKKVALSNGGTAHIAGGAGRKILAAGEGLCDLTIQHFNTHLWDTCCRGRRCRRSTRRRCLTWGASSSPTRSQGPLSA